MDRKNTLTILVSLAFLALNSSAKAGVKGPLIPQHKVQYQVQVNHPYVKSGQTRENPLMTFEPGFGFSKVIEVKVTFEAERYDGLLDSGKLVKKTDSSSQSKELPLKVSNAQYTTSNTYTADYNLVGNYLFEIGFDGQNNPKITSVVIRDYRGWSKADACKVDEQNHVVACQ